MPVTYLVAPQWQGSTSARALRLVDGAAAIGAELPRSALRIEPPSGAGSSLDSGVARLSSIQSVRDDILTALRQQQQEQENELGAEMTTVIIGGDCGVELGAIQHAVARQDLVVVWLDAHGDLNTPDSSPSGAFGGMVLRTLLGEGPATALLPVALTPGRVILAGARALDDAESDFIAASGLCYLPPETLSEESLSAAILASGARSVYLHIDLDILDPVEFSSVGSPEPFGLSLVTLLALIAAARAVLPVAGAGITGFAPPTPDAAANDLSSILRILGAVSKKI